MSFWDTSALVKLLVEEEHGAAALHLFETEMEAGDDLIVWWGTRLEAVHAIARRAREGALSDQDAKAALENLNLLSDLWREVPPSRGVRDEAERLLKAHPLRTADSLQLAATVAAARARRSSRVLVTYDLALARVAELEGFSSLAPT